MNIFCRHIWIIGNTQIAYHPLEWLNLCKQITKSMHLTLQKNAIVLPCSQLSPCHPGGHLQMYPLRVFPRVPPFLQGCSFLQCWPETRSSKLMTLIVNHWKSAKRRFTRFWWSLKNFLFSKWISSYLEGVVSHISKMVLSYFGMNPFHIIWICLHRNWIIINEQLIWMNCRRKTQKQ